MRLKRADFRGEIDYDKKEIKINASREKNKERGELLNSIVHEELHRIHPRMKEKNIKILAEKKIVFMRPETKQKLYNRFR